MKPSITKSLIAILTVCAPIASSVAQPRVEWIRSYYNQSDTFLRDVFRKADASLALCGYTEDYPGPRRMYVVNTGEDGDILFEGNYPDDAGEDDVSFGRSLIETDAGAFMVGGYSTNRDDGGFGDIALVHIADDGEQIWFRQYGPDNARSDCNGVIELKSGIFAIAGWTRENREDQAYLALINEDGEALWERSYGDEGTREYFVALREVADEGIVALGQKASGGESDFWLVKTDYEGEVIWERRLNGEGIETPIGMTSCAGGFALAGQRGSVEVNHEFILKRVDRNGGEIFSRDYRIWEDRPYAECRGIARMPDDGFVLVGFAYTMGNPTHPAVLLRTNRGGDEQWRMAQVLPDANYTRFDVAITTPEGNVIVAGDYPDGDSVIGLVESFFPDATAPRIVRRNPLESPVKALPDDTILFSIYAEDEEDSMLYYYWLAGDDTLSLDTLYLYTAREIGQDSLHARVSDGQMEDNTRWTIQVTDLYIATHTPDTLDLAIRRGVEVDFSIDSVATIFGEVDYAWTLTDRNSGERFDSGTEAGATIDFERSGNYTVEGMAYRGESHDEVVWEVAVRGAIYAYWPEELELIVDTMDAMDGMDFMVFPFNPESDSLHYIWQLDDDLLADDSTSDSVRVRFGGEGDYQVRAIVMDGGEGDTVNWEVSVRANDVKDELRITNYELRVEVCPNPFNGVTTINYVMPGEGRVKLKVYDIYGRELADLNGKRKTENGKLHSVAWNAEGMPTGIYLIRLETPFGNKISRAVLIR